MGEQCCLLYTHMMVIQLKFLNSKPGYAQGEFVLGLGSYTKVWG